MKKIYAMTGPALTRSGDADADKTSLVVAPGHKINHEQVCGYPVGDDTLFFDTLEGVKECFEHVIAKGRAPFSGRMKKSAIIELEFDQGQIAGFGKIYTVESTKEVMKAERKRAHFFKIIEVPVWKELEISPSDRSANALTEINRQYQEELKESDSMQLT